MRHKKVKLCAALLLGLGLTSLHAQEAITASGGNASGMGGSVSYSVGQIFYATTIETSGSVAEGILQPYEISEIMGIENPKDKMFGYLVYPNPTTDNLVLKTKSTDYEQLSCELFDNAGKLLLTNKSISNETNIAMSNFGRGTYYLKVLQNQKEVKTFKIIKN